MALGCHYHCPAKALPLLFPLGARVCCTLAPKHANLPEVERGSISVRGRRLPRRLGWLRRRRPVVEATSGLPGVPWPLAIVDAATAARQEGVKGEVAAFKIVSPWRVNTPEGLRAEIIAAEEALALRAEVDGAPVVYDSPSVSISLRKVSPDALTKNGAELEAADKAQVKIPADPRVKGRHGGPVIVTITSYHTRDRIKELPTVKYGANRQTRRVSGAEAGRRHKEDRVDFFMTKTSVSWRGTVNVKVPGLSAEVPAHDRPWQPENTAESVAYREEKQQLRAEVEALVDLPEPERRHALRILSRRWHPDKNPQDEDRATEVFSFLQDLKESLLGTPL